MHAHLVITEESQVPQNCPPIARRSKGLLDVLMNKSQYPLSAEASAEFKLKKKNEMALQLELIIKLLLCVWKLSTSPKVTVSAAHHLGHCCLSLLKLIMCPKVAGISAAHISASRDGFLVRNVCKTTGLHCVSHYLLHICI